MDPNGNIWNTKKTAASTFDSNNNRWTLQEGLKRYIRKIYIPRRKLSYVPGPLLIITLLFATTFGLILPKYCEDWVHSVYFRGDPKAKEYVARALDKNTERLYWAQEYFSLLQDDAQELPRWNEPLNLVVVIIGMQRKLDNYNPNYLLQTTAEVHRQFHSDTLFINKKLFICNVNKEPKNLVEVEETANHIKVISRFGGDYPGEKFSEDKWEKSKEDYAFCLNRAVDDRPEYVLVLEDDVILKPNFFPSLHTHLYTNVPLVQESPASLMDEANWAYIKLYYPPKWSGFSKDFRHYAELAGIASFGGSICVVLHNIIWYLFHKGCSAHRIYTTAWFITGAIYFLCLVIAIGRPYVMDFVFSLTHHSHLIPAKNCCTQAVLYSGDVVPHLTQYLYSTHSTIDKSHDILMDQWVDNNDFVRYLSEPYMVNHIGLISTVRVWAKKAAYFIY